MILVDANLLLYSKLSSFSEHTIANTWLDEKLNGPDRVALPWESLLAFLRLSTNTRLFPRPLSMAKAWEQVRAWMSLETTWNPSPTDHHEEVLHELLRPGGITPKLVMDAHLAAMSIGCSSHIAAVMVVFEGDDIVHSLLMQPGARCSEVGRASRTRFASC